LFESVSEAITIRANVRFHPDEKPLRLTPILAFTARCEKDNPGQGAEGE
jgi:hypothetical protein